MIEARQLTPFEREIEAVSRFNLAEIVRPGPADVELVLAEPGALPFEIQARITAPADRADRVADALNSTLIGTARWRRAVTYSEPLNTLCSTCGTRHCGCNHSSGLKGVREHDRGDR